MKKKLLATLAAGLVAYPGLVWLLGFTVHGRVNDTLEQLLAQAPYLTVVENSYQRGWYSSQQDLTFRVGGGLPLARVVSAQPLEFHVHNVIHHGPVCGLGCFGQARVDSQLMLGAAARAALQPYFGAREPLSIQTRVGFLGGGSTRVSSPAISAAVRIDGGRLSWDGFDLRVGFGRHLDSLSVRGLAPHLLLEGRDGGRVEFSGLRLDGDMQRALRSLYSGAATFRLQRLGVSGGAGAVAGTVSIDDLHYQVRSDASDGFMSMTARIGTGGIAYRGGALKEIRYDFTLRHLQMEALEAMTEAMRPASGEQATPADRQLAVLTETMRTQAFRLLAYDPVLVLDHVGVATADGEAVLTGSVRFTGLQPSDLREGAPALALLDKLDADLDLAFDDALLKSLPGGGSADAQLQKFAQQGLITRTQGRSHTRLVYRHGRLTVNGRPLPVPGLPAAPAMAPDAGTPTL